MLIYANPSTRPPKAKSTPTKAKRKRNAASKGAKPMAKRRSAAQRAATKRMLAANKSRKRHHNPSPRKARSRRRYSAPVAHSRRRRYRNPGILSGGKSFLGELASTQGLLMLGAAAVAPTAVDMIHERIVPDAYRFGWWGLLTKALLAGGIAYGLDRVVKQRKAAIGFAVGAGGSLIAQAVKTFQVAQALPAVAPPVQDQIAQNPAMYRELMNNNGNFGSMNGYEMAPVGGYELAPLAEDFEGYN